MQTSVLSIKVLPQLLVFFFREKRENVSITVGVFVSRFVLMQSTFVPVQNEPFSSTPYHAVSDTCALFNQKMQ